MRLPRAVSILLSTMVSLVSASCGQGPASEGDKPRAARDVAADRAAVEEIVRSHWKAINTLDTATITAQHTNDISILMTEIPARFTVPSPTADSLFPILLASKPHYVIEDLQVQMLGDVGVASFFMSGGVVLPNGKADDRRRRVTEVWVRQADGGWKEAHHHDSVFSSL